jgi:hypothetical protein
VDDARSRSLPGQGRRLDAEFARGYQREREELALVVFEQGDRRRALF